MDRKPVISRIAGFQDVLEDELVVLESLKQSLRDCFRAHGYRLIETPLLEPTDLYLRKSGGAFASRIYAFTDQGGNRVSLRPEFTASVLRVYLEEGGKQVLPLRWQYAGPIVRYRQRGRAPRHQTTQLGVELLGSASPRAEAEVISLACQGLRQLGLTRYRVILGHQGAISGLLEGLGLSERVVRFLLENLRPLCHGEKDVAEVRQELEAKGFLGEERSGDYLKRVVTSLKEEEARSLLQGLLQSLGPAAPGGRGAEEILDRFFQKIKEADDSKQVEKGLALLAEFCLVKGEPVPVLQEAASLTHKYGLNPAPLEPLRQTVELLSQEDLKPAKIILDLGLARELAYYTGMVFDVTHDLLPPELVLGGGGRYDGLVKALGGEEELPALGFALRLERLGEAIKAEGKAASYQRKPAPGVLVVPETPLAYGKALRLAESLRHQGQVVEMEVVEAPLKADLEYARRRGLSRVLVVNEAGEVAEQAVNPFAVS